MIADDDVAARLRGFGPLGLVAILVILDLTALAIIYWDIEAAVAHLIF